MPMRTIYLQKNLSINGRDALRGRALLDRFRGVSEEVLLGHAVLNDEAAAKIANADVARDVISRSAFERFRPNVVYVEGGLRAGDDDWKLPRDLAEQFCQTGGVLIVADVDGNELNRHRSFYDAAADFFGVRARYGEPESGDDSAIYGADTARNWRGDRQILCDPAKMVTDDWVKPIFKDIPEILVGAPGCLGWSGATIATGNRDTTGLLLSDRWIEQPDPCPFAGGRQIGDGFALFIAGNVSADVWLEGCPHNTAWLTNVATFFLAQAQADAERRRPPRPHDTPRQNREEQLRRRIAEKNEATLNNLVTQLRTPLGVIPFVGAGLSAPVRIKGRRMPQWKDLLSGLARGRSIEEEVAALLTLGKFEDAASLVDDDRPNVLPQSVRDAFDGTVERQSLTGGALANLPFLANGPVITTNYDRVLEQVFAAAGLPFDDVIIGPREDQTVAAMHANARALIKMHGDCRDREHQVLTAESYEAAYGVAAEAGDQQGRRGGLAWLLFTNRPLLFLGASLEQDRTVGVLRAIRQRLRGIAHYAILSAEHLPAMWEEREKTLDAMGVRPLWFYPGCFQEIDALLREVLEQSSTTVLKAAASDPAPPPVNADDTAMAALRPRIGVLIDAPARAQKAQLKLMSDALLSGKLAFFLGAGACLDPTMLGADFYRRLAEEFDCPPLPDGDRTAAAAYIIGQLGIETFWKFARRDFATGKRRPSIVHRYIAALPGYLRDHGGGAPLCIVSTNVDTLMEAALTEAGEPFQLLYYVNEGTSGQPCFLERSPDGRVRQIDQPRHLRSLDAPQHLVVKMGGGLSFFGDIDEQAAVERGQLERLAQRIPDILPDYIRRELDARSLLFLGHGLAEPDVRKLIQTFATRPGNIGSWAIQRAPQDQDARRAWAGRAADWKAQRLTVLNWELEDFIARFAVALDQARALQAK